MTHGELLYLLLTLAAFGTFMTVLAYYFGVTHSPRRQVAQVARETAATRDGGHAHAR